MPTTAKRRLQEQVSRLVGSSLNLLFPPQCCGCGRAGYHLCGDCYNSFEHLREPLCSACSIPIAAAGICRDCEYSERAFDRVISVLAFTGVAQKAIYAFKYNGRSELAEPFAELMNEKLRKEPLSFDLISNVPMHASRRAERPYDHAVLLARQLSNKLNCERLLESELVRIKETTPQVKLDFGARQHNVKGAFSAETMAVNGKAVLLVDDVCTTGATLDACAQALKMAGAASVVGLTLARTVFQPGSQAAT